MNIQIKWNGTDITSSVIEYSREQDICSGFGTLDMNVEAVTARGFNPWHTIEVYEEGTKVHTYNIASIEEIVPDTIYAVTCQDDSKRLTDYFIDSQFVIDYPSTCRYWIELFLGYAGVDYNFNTSSQGNQLAENTTLGATSAYDAIINLLQLNGWYFYFDNENVCQIGKLNVNATEPVKTFYGTEVTNIGYTKSDKMLRNRAVVWGAGDPITKTWIWADTSTMTPWNRPGNDYRTVVYANPAIKTFGIAYSLALLILNEFSQTIPEKNISAAGSYPEIELGSFIRGITNKLTVDGMVTHITINMSSAGLVSTYNLDQRCPRLFGYANWNDWVYIGTQGSGVWRKYIYSPTWNNYSTGITDLNIKDLAAYNGLLSTISTTITPASGVASGISPNPIVDSQLYVRHTSLGSWMPYSPPGFWNYYPASGTEPEYLVSGIIAEATSINRNYGINGLVAAAFTIPGSGEWTLSGEYYAPSGNLSWVTGITVDRLPIYTQQIVITTSGYLKPAEIAVIDMDTNWDGQNLISVYHGRDIWYQPPTYSGNMTAPWDWGDIPKGGMKHFWVSDIGYISQWYSGTMGRTVHVAVPPPTNGMAIMLASGEMQSGYKVFSATIQRRGGIAFLDDIETDGHAYGKGLDGDGWYVDEFIFRLASGVWLPSGQGLSNWYEHNKYHWDDPTLYEASIACTYGGLSRIDDNNFGIGIVDFTYDDLGTSHIGYWWGHVGLNRETKVATFGDFKITPINENESASPTGAFGSASSGGPGRYFLYIYGVELAPETQFQGGVCVLDTYTGEAITNHMATPIYNSGYSIRGIGGKATPNNAFAAIVTRNETPGNTDVFNIYFFCLNIHTGALSEHVYTYKSGGPGDPSNTQYESVIVPTYTSGGNNYTSPSISAACENPDTGNGIGHLIVVCQHSRVIEHPYPIEDEPFLVDTLFDIKFNTNGGGGEMRVYDDVWDTSVLPRVKLSGSIPSWATPNRYVCYETICSRFSDTNPGGMLVGDGENKRLALVSSDDPGKIEAEFETLPPDYGYNEERKVFTVYPHTDDIDDTIYAHVDIIPSGFDPTRPITVGYGWGGAVKKVLFPSQSQTPYGAPFHDKVIIEEGDPADYSGRIWYYIPIMFESGRQRIETEYLILKHSPTVSGELLASGLFDVIYKGMSPMMVDTAKGIPTVIYDLPTGTTTTGSGMAPPSGGGYGSFPSRSSSHLGRSYLNEYGSFDIIYPNAPVFDARTFDISGPLDMFPASGVPSGILGRFIGVAGGYRGLIMYNTEPLSNAYTPISTVLSGAFIHLDFTNNFPDPFMFVSTSGVGTVSSGRFLQRDSEELLWHDYSATLPSGMITIIRADDRM